MRILKAILFVLTGSMMVPAAAFGQASIAGVVKDSSGAVLPGVTVEAASPVLIEKARSVITDTTGQYKIIDLRPGTYAVTFTLTGFEAVKRQGIELTGSFAATVNAELKVGSVAETVTVTGESPIVDIQSVGQQRVLNKDVIDAIPAGRNYLDAAVLIPGLQAAQPGRGSLMDVGGTNNLQTSTMTIHGNRSTDTRVLVDGLSIRNIGSEGQFSNFIPDTGSTQEVTVDYSAGSAELPFGGLRVNHVPREGGNSFKASFFGTGANSSFQGSNYTQDLANRGLTTPNSLYLMYDVNPSGGGPIVRDKLWFYTSGRWQSNQNYIAGVFANQNAGNPAAWAFSPDSSQRGVFHMIQKSGNARLTWQASQKHKFSLSFDDQSRIWDDERATVAPEAITQRRFPEEWIGTAGWSAPLTSRLLLDVRFSNHAEVYYAIPPTGAYATLIPVLEQSSGLMYRGPGLADPCCFLRSAMPRIINTAAALSYVTGAHAFKFGVSDIAGAQTGNNVWNQSGLSYRFLNGVPNQLTERATPYSYVNNLNAELGLFAQDKWTVDRLTLSGGIRFDYMNSGFPQQTLGPALLVPLRNITFPATSWFDFKDISPRVGAAYDLFGDGKTAVKGNLGRYVLASNPTTGNPVSNLAQTVTRNWSDANQNFTPDCDLLNPQANGECGTISDLTFGSVKPSTAFDPATLGGWGKRPYNWEFSASVQRQVAPRVGVDVGYFRRIYGNFTLTDNLAVTPADYSPYSITAPVDPKLPGGGGNVVAGLYDLNPNKVGQVNNYVTFANNFGNQIEHWNGIDASVNVRLQGGLLVQGGLSTGRTTTDNCDVVAKVNNPSPLYCHVDTNFLTQFKLLGTYTIPKADVRVAATFQSFPGPQVLANYIVTTAQVQPSLGRPLSGNAANVTVNVVPPGTMFGERANQLDLRFSKLLRFGPARAAVNLDLANVLNANAVLLQNNSYSVWQMPQGIMDARLFKASLQFDF